MTPPPSVGYLLSKTCNFNHPSLPLWGNIVYGWPLSDNWLIKLALVLIMKYQIILHITVSIICALETRQLGYTLHLWCLGNLVCIKISLKKYSHYQKLKIFSSASYKTWNNQDLKLFSKFSIFCWTFEMPKTPCLGLKGKVFSVHMWNIEASTRFKKEHSLDELFKKKHAWEADKLKNFT